MDKNEGETTRPARTSGLGKSSPSVWMAIFCVAAVAVPTLYALHTHHIWEDFFITFRCSENLADGNGLVYQVGRRVHVFTSPLGVLLPALCHVMTGRTDYLHALWLFRILFCVPAFALGGVFVLKSFRESRGCEMAVPVAFAALLYLFDVKSVMFSMNGMETAFMLLFLAASILLMFRGIRRNWLAAGAAWAGLMWTRPDSCVHIAALMAATLAFAEKKERLDDMKGILKAAGVTTALYLPWFLWAWWYYGSPVPNTVLAKSAVNTFSLKQTLFNWPVHAAWAFAPVYPAFSKWPPAISIHAYAIASFSLFYWLAPIKDGFGRRLSFVFFILSLYFAAMGHPYPWYYPPMAMVGNMAFVAGIWTLFSRLRKGRAWATALYAAVLLNAVFLFAASTYQMKMQQAIIENGIRKNLGLWLKDHVRKDQTVFLECLGYIGYFSERGMLDYPGLATPESVELLKSRKLDFGGLLLALNPDWAVLRPFEAAPLLKSREFRGRYAYVAHFSAEKLLEKAGYIPGIGYLQYDAVFIIFKRKADAPKKSAAPNTPRVK